MKPLVILGWILLAGEVLFVASLLLMRNMGDDAAGRGLATAWGLILGAVVLVPWKTLTLFPDRQSQSWI